MYDKLIEEEQSQPKRSWVKITSALFLAACGIVLVHATVHNGTFSNMNEVSVGGTESSDLTAPHKYPLKAVNQAKWESWCPKFHYRCDGIIASYLKDPINDDEWAQTQNRQCTAFLDYMEAEGDSVPVDMARKLTEASIRMHKVPVVTPTDYLQACKAFTPPGDVQMMCNMILSRCVCDAKGECPDDGSGQAKEKHALAL